MFKLSHTLSIFFILFYSQSSLASIEAAAIQNFEETFATAVVLSDNETLTIGMGNFDPDVLLKPHQQNVTESDSIKLRKQLNIYSLPYTFVLNKNNEDWSDKIMIRFTYIKQQSESNLFDGFDVVADDNTDKIYSAYIAYSHYQPIAKNLKLRVRLGGYLMHHKNKHSYNNSLSAELKPLVDGVFYNTTANAAIVEPNAKLSYTQETNWGKWQLSSDLNYFIGKVYSGSESSIGAVPDGWRFNNGAKVHFNLYQADLHAESIYFKFQRTDLHGDMTRSLETDHFYEMGIGVLLDIHKLTSLAENVGIGININRGSSLSGGSIVFYFNEF